MMDLGQAATINLAQHVLLEKFDNNVPIKQV
jgi:hypothetical protein